MGDQQSLLSYEASETVGNEYEGKVILGIENKVKTSPSVALNGSLTDSRSSRSIARSSASEFPWSLNLFWPATRSAPMMSASYPYVQIRAVGISCGSKAWGQKTFDFLCVHVVSRFPVSP